jgi:hypothetical protein
MDRDSDRLFGARIWTGIWTGCLEQGNGQVAGCFEQGNERSGFMKFW